MIQTFIDRFMTKQDVLRAFFAAKHPDSYAEIVKQVVLLIGATDEYDQPDPERITEIDYGHYQGTLVYVIGAGGYQPDDYWFVKVGYGSCSGCDTLEAIRSYSDEPPSDEQVKDYMTLALHVAQGIKEMSGEEA